GDPAHRETLLDAAALARRIEDAGLLARAALTNFHQSVSSTGGVDLERVAALEDALAAVGTYDSEERALLLAHLAVELTFGADIARRNELSGDAVAIARRLGKEHTLAYVLACRSDAIAHANTAGERETISREQADLAERVGDPTLLYHAALNGSLLELG